MGRRERDEHHKKIEKTINGGWEGNVSMIEDKKKDDGVWREEEISVQEDDNRENHKYDKR